MAAGDTEEMPDPGDLDGFASPRAATHLFGHTEAATTLLSALAARKMAHAWILTGPDGIGKATFAYRFAKHLLTHGAEAGETPDLSAPETSAIARRVSHLSEPNLLALQRPWDRKAKKYRSAITVDEVRRIGAFLGSTAGRSGWRVVIIDRAGDLNVNAANALLKSLEEPPANVVFLMVATAAGQVPVTVRSRSRVLSMAPLREEALGEAIAHACEAAGIAPPKPKALAQATALADGSVRRALDLVANDGLKLHGQLCDLVAAAPAVPFTAVHKLADDLTKAGAEARFNFAYGLLGDIVARAVRHAATGSGAVGAEVAIAEKLVAPALAEWAGVWETLTAKKAQADILNLDRKTLFLEAFFLIDATAGRAAA